MKEYWKENRKYLIAIFSFEVVFASYYLINLLVSTPLGFPYDDAWIHWVFARNLSQHGQLSFNVGQWSGGTSSVLWVILLALGSRILSDGVWISVAYGVLFYSLGGLALFTILQDCLGSTSAGKVAALFGALVYSQMGPILYLSLAGMETALFLSLGLGAILSFAHRRFPITGVLLGMILLTRVEGLALFVLINVYNLLVDRGKSARLKERTVVFLLPLVIFLPYLAYNLAIVGNPLPTTLIGRKWLWGFPDQTLLLSAKNTTAYLKMWGLYLDRWILALGTTLSRAILWLLLLVGGFAGFYFALRSPYARRCEKTASKGLLLLYGWFILHNIAYLVLMPFPSPRHQAINFMMVGVLLSNGLFFLSRLIAIWLRRATSLFWVLVCPLLFLLLLPMTMGWAQYYRDSVGHINQVHVQAGRWIEAHLPPDAVVAAFDIGAVKYFGQRETIDLGGLLDSRYATRYLYRGKVLDYVRQTGAAYMAMVGTDEPQGGIAYRLGLLGDRATAEMELHILQTFRVPSYFGSPFSEGVPYYYFYPASLEMIIYRVEWKPRF